MDVVHSIRTGPEIRALCVSRPQNTNRFCWRIWTSNCPRKQSNRQMQWKLFARNRGEHCPREANWGSRARLRRSTHCRHFDSTDTRVGKVRRQGEVVLLRTWNPPTVVLVSESCNPTDDAWVAFWRPAKSCVRDQCPNVHRSESTRCLCAHDKTS